MSGAVHFGVIVLRWIGDGALHSIESGSDSERCEALLVEAFQERLGEQGGCME